MKAHANMTVITVITTTMMFDHCITEAFLP